MDDKRENRNKTAGVTGASGIIGRRIVRLLVLQGYRVKALSRQRRADEAAVHYLRGGLEDEETIDRMLTGIDSLFHCAGERYHDERMHDVNVKGTKQLLRIARRHNLRYFCHVSSAGVIGKANRKFIDEFCPCDPQNLYEQTKLEAEQAVLKGIQGCRTVILRPTNVVAFQDHGVLETVTRHSLKNFLKLWISGGENTHLVHAENVAAAAIYLMALPDIQSEIYFVSADHEQGTRLKEIAALYRHLSEPSLTFYMEKLSFVPIWVPQFIRRVAGKGANRGDIVYSSRKLTDTGFKFPVNVYETICRIAGKD